MTLTASGRKTTTAPVGTVWDLVVKASTVPDVDGDTAHPVRVHVTRPDGSIHQVVATPTKDGHAAPYVLDVPGDYAAVAVVVDAEGAEVERLDGLKATATGPDPEVQATPDAPDPEPGGTTPAA